LSMWNDEKFCIIRMPDGQKHYYGVVIRKLLYTRRDRSRRIRDEWTACKPEVEIWRRPRLPIRPAVHQNVYLAPLPSYTELRLKVGQSTQLLMVWHRWFFHAFLDNSKVNDISDHFSKYFRFLNSTSDPQIWTCCTRFSYRKHFVP